LAAFIYKIRETEIMGRKPVDKERFDAPELKKAWIKRIASLFLQQGFTIFTMDEISARLRVSKATLYKYYASKEVILDAVVRYKIEEIEAFEPLLQDNQIGFTERYFDVIKAASLTLAEFSSQFVQDIKQKYPELWEKIHSFQDRALSAAQKFYQHGIDKGIMHANLNPHLLALTDKIFIYAAANPNFLKEHNISLEEAFDGFFQMKSKGIFK
jgi:AcrR family transcriptional regulator